LGRLFGGCLDCKLIVHGSHSWRFLGDLFHFLPGDWSLGLAGQSNLALLCSHGDLRVSCVRIGGDPGLEVPRDGVITWF
jgi:hypothetical protein